MEEKLYYERIVYKKNAFEDLKTYIKLNYANKNVVLVTSSSVGPEDTTSVLNALFCGTESVFHFACKNQFDMGQLNLLKQKIQKSNANVLVSFGEGVCCNVVKYFANVFNLQYIVCPSAANSLAYFLNFCVNPYDASKSFYAKMPQKIFIQDSIIKNSSCNININGLCFLHALRSVYVEGVINNKERQKFVYAGLEKLFNKLEAQQANILINSEDSNLVLMDIFIDFGFFMSFLNVDNFYLFNMFLINQKMQNTAFCNNMGKKFLMCGKTILVMLKKFLEVNCLKILEKPKYKAITKILKNYKINYKKLKNNQYFYNFSQKQNKKIKFLNNKELYYKQICLQLNKISDFGKQVKNIYKVGIELEDNIEKVLTSLLVAPYIYDGGELVDFVASSGILNSFVYAV